MEEKRNCLELKSTEMPTNFKVFPSDGQNCLTGDDEPVLLGKLIFFCLAWRICHKNRIRNEILTAVFKSQVMKMLTNLSWVCSLYDITGHVVLPHCNIQWETLFDTWIMLTFIFILFTGRYRGSYMSAYLLLFLWNESTEIIWREALPSIIFVSVNEFHKNNFK